MAKSKSNIRKQVRQARRAVAAPYARNASFKFSEFVATLPEYQAASTLSAYLPFDGEADPLPLIDRAIQEGKQVYVPVIVGKQEPLVFAPWDRQTGMKRNAFGIEEPDVPPDQRVSIQHIDVCITPLVAFDERCNRIGVGGGYYDRTLAQLNDSTSSTTTCGVAYELQRLDKIETREWDVRLDFVVTELAIYRGRPPA